MLPPDALVHRQHAGGMRDAKGDGTTNGEQTQHGSGRTQRETDAENESLMTRVKELEALCEQKVRALCRRAFSDAYSLSCRVQDQSVCSLKSIVEQQEVAYDEKVKIVTAKYEQVKAINLALQVPIALILCSTTRMCVLSNRDSLRLLSRVPFVCPLIRSDLCTH